MTSQRPLTVKLQGAFALRNDSAEPGKNPEPEARADFTADLQKTRKQKIGQSREDSGCQPRERGDSRDASDVPARTVKRKTKMGLKIGGSSSGREGRRLAGLSRALWEAGLAARQQLVPI